MWNKYVVDNRWFITNSKIKLYMASKEAFKKVYVDEVDTSMIEDWEALKRWDMVDKYVLTRDIFDKEFAFPAWKWLKDDLAKACLTLWIPVLKWDRVSDLEAKLYGNKTVLPDWEKKLLLWIYRELERQPLYDMEWKYEHQKELIVEYKWYKLKAKLDRLWLERDLIRDLKTCKDVEYNHYNSMTKMEHNLNTFDEYWYWFQLARYAILVYIHKNKRYDGVIDAVKTTWNYAYESYFYHSDTLKRIAHNKIFPVLDALIADIENNTFVDELNERGEIINNRYYPILDAWLQKDFIIIEPSF